MTGESWRDEHAQIGPGLCRGLCRRRDGRLLPVQGRRTRKSRRRCAARGRERRPGSAGGAGRQENRSGLSRICRHDGCHSHRHAPGAGDRISHEARRARRLRCPRGRATVPDRPSQLSGSARPGEGAAAKGCRGARICPGQSPAQCAHEQDRRCVDRRLAAIGKHRASGERHARGRPRCRRDVADQPRLYRDQGALRRPPRA